MPEPFLDDKVLRLLMRLEKGEALLSSIIQDGELRSLFNNSVDGLISGLHLLAALNFIEYRHVLDEDESDDVKITVTSLGRRYLESVLMAVE